MNRRQVDRRSGTSTHSGTETTLSDTQLHGRHVPTQQLSRTHPRHPPLVLVGVTDCHDTRSNTTSCGASSSELDRTSARNFPRYLGDHCVPSCSHLPMFGKGACKGNGPHRDTVDPRPFRHLAHLGCESASLRRSSKAPEIGSTSRCAVPAGRQGRGRPREADLTALRSDDYPTCAWNCLNRCAMSCTPRHRRPRRQRGRSLPSR